MVRWILGLTVALAITTTSFANTSRYWVFFNDKGVVPGQEQRALDSAQDLISARSVERRLHNGAEVVNFGDIPVYSQYVDQVQRLGVQIRTQSKWLNAVSIEATPMQIEQFRGLQIVKEIRPFSRKLCIDQPTRSEHSAVDSAEYGNSFRQNEICRIPELHERGLSGNGVLLCILDTGFRTEHEALDGLNYLAMRDFIFGDSIVHNEPGLDSAEQHWHGTACLSAMAGVDSNNIIGPAFGAQLMLAKTEYVPTETSVEEDYYVAGMEWADSAGADITSSSLGYIDWYTQDQMDGRTTVVAQAVTEAQRRGILVVTAQGNERNSAWNTVISPADADSILAIGGVDSFLVLSSFSSPGPTADGRIKPDCAAQATDVWSANAFTTDQYSRVSGTSLATPIAAGVAALIMEANPEWTAQQVRLAILETASQAEFPDNDLGYGVIDGVAAADYVFSGVSPRGSIPQSLSLIAYPNPVNGYVTISLNIDRAQSGKLVLYDLLGRQIVALDKQVNIGANSFSLPVDQFSSGKYFLRFDGAQESVTVPVVILK